MHPREFNETIAQPLPAAMTTNSSECAWHRTAGTLVSKEITLTGGAGATVYDLFTVDGIVDIRALYANFTAVTDTTTASNMKFAWHDGTNPNDLTAVVDASGATVGSFVSKIGVAADALDFTDGLGGGIVEVASKKPLQETILVTKAGATNKIQLLVTQDAATAATLKCWIAWTCRHEGSYVTAA